MLNIGVVTPIPTPYRDPFWNAVASEPDVSLHVYYCASTTADRPWDPNWRMRYRSEVLPGYNILGLLPWQGYSYWNPSIVERLRAGAHDALVIGGYNYPTLLAAIRFARKRGIPYYLMSESHLHHHRPAWRLAAKHWLVRSVVTGATGCFPTGSWAREYLLSYGAKPDRLWYIPNVPDVRSFDAKARELAVQRPLLREKLGIGDGPNVLFLGRLVGFKRVDLLIEAFARATVPPSARLVIVGDGVERAGLESLARRLGVEDRVQFKGFVEPDDVPLWYAAADLMVLPAVGETWSVALIEALASGLPVITTDTVGAAADAVRDPLVGTVVPSGDAVALANAISSRLAEPSDRDAVRDRWAPIREQFRYDVLARRFIDAIRTTAGTGAAMSRS